MLLQFAKYQGTGNDFIMLNNLDGQIQLNKEQIVRLCDRRFGIGSDGLILIEKSEEANFKMNFYNPDASQSFCGNGSRCVVRFAQTLKVAGSSGTFVAIDGTHEFSSDEQKVKIHMRDVAGISLEGNDYVMNTGSPHLMQFVKDVEHVDILPEARQIRYSETHKKNGINVNFVQELDGKIKMRTYERGVEDETLSCGTGVTAAALSYAFRHPGAKTLEVLTRGGLLEVKYNQIANDEFIDVWLCGPAEFVFEGEMNL